MLQYIKAELYRLARKRSTYIYYGVLVAAFVGIMLLLVNVDSPTFFLELGFGLVQVVSLFVTTQVFLAVYCDDIASKTYANTISTGLSRTALILSKVLLFVIHTVTVFIGLVLVYGGLYVYYGGSFEGTQLILVQGLLKFLVCVIASSVAYATLSSIVLLQFQSSTISVALYLFFNLGFVYNILNMVRNIIPFLDEAMQFSITEQIMNLMGSGPDLSLNVQFFGIMAAYVLVSISISTFLFNKKEISV
ncbi:hypothetical protein AOC36_00825 [Erysipelothrix larvae]|uniref:Uncharacterized protein n=1 Tax=Erysipelothrix larvae TaxID=1514105 RepID=A0A0X8GY63_9FIRM|nr:hypothetical protein [Erysipelothrix larvae]AMC92586.1 hypothetical protein AOC36_00825 [Erysipelothrix larvae]